MTTGHATTQTNKTPPAAGPILAGGQPVRDAGARKDRDMTSYEAAREIERGRRISACMNAESKRRQEAKDKAEGYRTKAIKQLRNAARNFLESDGHMDLDGVKHSTLNDTLVSLAEYMEHDYEKGKNGHDWRNPFARRTYALLRELTSHVADRISVS